MDRRLTDYFTKTGKKKLAAVFLTTALAGVAGHDAQAANSLYAPDPGRSPGPGRMTDVTDYSYSDLITDAQDGRVREITQKGEEIFIRFEGRDGQYRMAVPANENIVDRFDPHGVDVRAVPAEDKKSEKDNSGSGFLTFMLLLGGGLMMWFMFQRMMMNRAQNGGGGPGAGSGPGAVGKSKAKLISPSADRVTFDDVAGADDAKEDLQEIIEFLKTPEKFGRLGGKVPKGVLLSGPPGTGKTLTAKAVAGEADVPFFETSGSDFVEMYVGVGAARVRDMFAQAKRQAPCILFIDEIDAVGKQRGGGQTGGHDEREQTLNQILVELDGFEENTGVIVIAATNRDDTLDKALLRSGRFDRKVTVPLPDVDGRRKILDVHMRKVPVGPDVSSLKIARATPGFSGADLANLVNEAALLATKRQKNLIGAADIEDAKDKIMMGAPRDSNIMTPEEVENTAWHEAGHALVALHMGANSDPIYKATIVPRGRALGMVMRLPEKDRVSYKLSQLKAEMAVAYGGRFAEEIHGGGSDAVTTGASNDIQQATNIASKMVREWGYSPRLGLIRYNEPEQGGYLGVGSRSRDTSEHTAKIIDEDIKTFADEAAETAKTILTEHRDQLETLAKALIKYETLTGEEIKRLVFEGKPVVRDYDEIDAGPEPRKEPPPQKPGGNGGKGGGPAAPSPGGM